jgi:hypothetical protein
MTAASKNKVVSPTAFYKHKKYASLIFATTKTENDKQLLGASTNIGKGEVTFIIAGGLQKPKQGDLEDGNNVIELKEPSAFIGPKGMSHPSKALKDMRRYISQKTDAPLPKADRSTGRGATAADALSKLLTIKWMNGKGEFPLGDWAKANSVPLSVVKQILDEYHSHVYSFTFRASKYVNSDYSFRFKEYGEDSFAGMFAEYQKQSSFKTLMIFDVGSEKVYTISSKEDAKRLFSQVGLVIFSGQDAHGLDGALGGKIHASKFKKLF